MSEAKPYDISKRLVWDAWEQVKENHGAAGVDGVSIAAFEKDLKRNQGLEPDVVGVVLCASRPPRGNPESQWRVTPSGYPHHC